MLLPDHEIRALCAEHALIHPFNPERLNPASYDVALGSNIMIEVAETPELIRHNIATHTKEDPYWLSPGEFILAETEEIFNLPDDPAIAAQFVLKSSRARSGIQHMLAGFCDPGWHGSRLTLELKNVRQKHRVALWPGLLIGQMVFMPLSDNPDRSYRELGHYNKHETVMPSWETLKVGTGLTV
jgi:dCTP deaminase